MEKMAINIPQVDLLKEGTRAGSKEVYKTLVAVFKEEPENPRVLADSESYLAYTLKNGRTLRLIQRSNNMKGSMRAHTKPIHAIKFVNYRSNVAASAAEKEFLVWVVTNENPPEADPSTSPLTVKIYFRLQDPVTVGNFAFFINSQVGIFDVLILYGKKAAVLESSKVIPNFKDEPLEAKLSSDSRELREMPEEATIKSLCSINNSGWFAFTVDPTLVAACTMRNRNTPAWGGCQGSPVLSLELLDLKSIDDPTLLMTASAVKCFQWRLTGDSEPKLLRTFWFGGNIVTMLSSRSTFAVFNDKLQVALVEACGAEHYSATVYDINTAVRAGSVCFNRKTNYGSVLVDAQAQVEMYQLTVSRDKDKEAAGTAAAISSPTTTGEAGVAAATPPASNAAGGVSKSAAVEGGGGGTAAAAAAKSYAAALLSGSAAAARREDEAAGLVASPVMDPAILSASKELPPPPHASAAAGPAAAATNTTATTATTATSTVTTTSSHIRNLMEQVQRGNVRATPPSITPPANTAAATTSPGEPTPAAAVAGANPNASAAARALLQNTALPQGLDGPLASATHASDELVRRELESLHTVSKNISQILQLTPEQIARDHEQLVNLALEAQMTQLQSAAGVGNGASPASTSPTTAAAAAAKDPNAEAFNSYAIVKLFAPIANDIARGVTIGIRSTLRTELDHAIRDALGASVRESQRNALKRRLDEVLQESTAHFSNEVRQRLHDFANRDLKDAFAQVNANTNALVEENRRLQTSLNDIVRCGVLEQLQATRKELQQLKEDLRSGNLAALGGGATGAAHGANPSSFQGARPSPETMLTTARAMLVDEGRPREALEYIKEARQPRLTLRLLKPLQGGDTYYGMVADSTISDELWLDVLTQVSTASALEGSTEADADARFVAELLLDVLCERGAMTSMKSAKAQGLMSNIRHFIVRQKPNMADSEGQMILRDLEKSIQ